MNSHAVPHLNGVFISYSHKDKKFLDELHAHLSHHVRTGQITYWDDTRLVPGTRWKAALRQALQSARVGVFLVSANFLASDFIATRELPPLLQAADQEGVIILSIIVGACVFKDTALSQFQSINAPSNPLNLMPRGKRDVVWMKAVKLIKNALQEDQ